MAERGVRTNLQQTQLPYWEYLGGQAITLDGATHTGATIPSTCSIVVIRAETAAVYYDINAAAASANSPGYIPSDQAEVLGPLANLVSLRLFSTGAAVVHLTYYREN